MAQKCPKTHGKTKKQKKQLKVFATVSVQQYQLIPPYLTAWNLGGGTSGNSTETFHRKMVISQYFTVFTTAGYEA